LYTPPTFALMQSQKTVFILGVNGFIGHHLLRRILKDTVWHVIGVDIYDDRMGPFKKHKRFTFYKVDMTKEPELVERLVKKSDVVIPLAGIATPSLYMTDPLRVFELDFEANLPIIRWCVKYKKRVIWPSTSEVYGMSPDKEFHPDTSPLVLGPISKIRWIYSNSKQLMDRVIWAYGRDRGLDYTLFRPFNWIGIGLDNLSSAKAGNARVITQFLSNVLRGEDLKLVDGGLQRRSFTHADDSIDALIKIIENKDGIATGKIYNIGNPKNNHSIRELAEMIVALAPNYPHFREHVGKIKIVSVDSGEHYGEGYQDMQNRVPYIENTRKDLDWEPKISLQEAVERTFEDYIEHLEQAREALS
jgi:nucleoside-diphosphate-sugar epimerase